MTRPLKHTYFPKNSAGTPISPEIRRTGYDGYFWIMGRIDDVLNVSGHRLGTMEIESALVSHPLVAEAAVVGASARHQGEQWCVCGTERRTRSGDAAKKIVCDTARLGGEGIGPIAKPDESALATTCRKRVPARSCDGCCARLPGRDHYAGYLHAGKPCHLEQLKEAVSK